MKVCFAYSNRSEYSILQPFIKYLERRIKVSVIDLSKIVKKIDYDRNLGQVFVKCYDKLSSVKYDYLCVLGDRRELPFIALAAFFLDIKIIHIGAGDSPMGKPTYDQLIRPIISILSAFQICFSKEAKEEIRNLFSAIPYLKSNVYFLGNPVFMETNYKKLKRPFKKKYDLVLLHPQSLSRENTIKDVNELNGYLKNKKTIFIRGNKDKNHDVIEKFYLKLMKEKRDYVFYDTLLKEKYFSLVKYCDKFYTNTSSISEIKFLNPSSLVNIGVRNKNRIVHKLNEKAPELLYKLLLKNYRK